MNNIKYVVYKNGTPIDYFSKSGFGMFNKFQTPEYVNKFTKEYIESHPETGEITLKIVNNNPQVQVDLIKLTHNTVNIQEYKRMQYYKCLCEKVDKSSYNYDLELLKEEEEQQTPKKPDWRDELSLKKFNMKYEELSIEQQREIRQYLRPKDYEERRLVNVNDRANSLLRVERAGFKVEWLTLDDAENNKQLKKMEKIEDEYFDSRSQSISSLKEGLYEPTLIGIKLLKNDEIKGYMYGRKLLDKEIAQIFGYDGRDFDQDIIELYSKYLKVNDKLPDDPLIKLFVDIKRNIKSLVENGNLKQLMKYKDQINKLKLFYSANFVVERDSRSAVPYMLKKYVTEIRAKGYKYITMDALPDTQELLLDKDGNAKDILKYNGMEFVASMNHTGSLIVVFKI